MKKIYPILIFIIISLFNNYTFAYTSTQDTTVIENINTDEDQDIDDLESDSDVSDLSEEDLIELDENYILITPFITVKSNQMKNGIDISNGKPTISLGVDISNSYGFGASFSRNSTLSSGLNYLNSNLSLSYEYEMSSIFSAELSYLKTFYSNEDVNPFASASNSLGLNFDLIVPHFFMDLSYSYSFGTSTINEFGLTLQSYIKLGDKFKISPSLNTVLAAYNHKKLTKTLGLSNILASLKFGYTFFENLNLSLTPAVAYTPVKVLSVKKLNTYLTLNLDYDFEINY